MTGDAPDTTPIQTPVELDLLARDVQRQTVRSASPLSRFITITSFCRRTEHLPPLWTASYYRTLYPAFSASIRHEYVCWTDPADWQTALRVLQHMKAAEWAQHESTFADTEKSAWEKTCLCLAGMGAFRTIHELLRAQGWVNADLSVREWSAVLNAHTVGLDAFREYCEALRTHGECPPFLLRARERWEHHRADGAQPGVILLDGQEHSSPSTGLVLHLTVHAKRSVNTRVHFQNALDDHNTDTMRQLSDAALAATAIVTERFRSRVPQYEWTVGFHEHEASYAGESMGIAAALSMAHLLQKDLNRTLRWTLRSNLVCTGGIDATGTVRELPDSVIPAKVRAAFFSAADALVLPARHAEDARLRVLALQQRYPDRRFEVYGVTSIDDCVSAQGIILSENRTIYDRGREFVRTHSVLLLAMLVFVLAAAGGYFWWKSLYGYPDLEYVTEKRIEENALVYNPHRDAHWQFRDFDRVVAPELPFGDLEIGADATRNVYLWNMTPTRIDVRLAIEGPQADQWYISWHGGEQSVNPTDSLRVMVKYAPTRAADENKASFTVRDAESGALLTQLQLTGAAGAPLPAGYALAFDGVDDMLFFGEKAIAFARDEGTIEFWTRLDAVTGCIMTNNRNLPQAPTIANMVLWYSNDSVSVKVGNSEFILPLGNRSIAQTGRWHHIALAYSRRDRYIQFILDGRLLHEKRDEFLIADVSTPYVTFGAYYNGVHMENPLKGALDELRVWDHALSADTVRARMHRRLSGLTPGLLGYWNFDVIAEVSAHNGNERSQDGLLRGRPSYIRSAAPLEISKKDIRLVKGPLGPPAVELQSCRWMQCGRDVIDSSPERSYAIRFYHTRGSDSHIFTVMNQDAAISLTTQAVGLHGMRPVEITLREGWNTFVCRIDREQTAEIFLNGQFLPSCTSADFQRGPSYRYEGLQVGISNDKYNVFGTQAIDFTFPVLRRKKTVSDFRVWKRRISDEAIAAYARGEPTPDGLAAHWPLDTLPDPDDNYRDRIHGHLLHIWHYRPWE